jgi:hypothetical protein
MSIVNGGYAKVTKRLYMIAVRWSDGGSSCEFQHETSFRMAAAKTLSAFRKHDAGVKIINEWCQTEGDDMDARTLEEARDWLRTPKGRSYVERGPEPMLDRG